MRYSLTTGSLRCTDLVFVISACSLLKFWPQARIKKLLKRIKKAWKSLLVISGKVSSLMLKTLFRSRQTNPQIHLPHWLRIWPNSELWIYLGSHLAKSSLWKTCKSSDESNWRGTDLNVKSVNYTGLNWFELMGKFHNSITDKVSFDQTLHIPPNIVLLNHDISIWLLLCINLAH